MSAKLWAGLLFAALSASLLPMRRAEFYSSVYKMGLLVQYEHYFIHHMEKFITDNENKIAYLKERLEEFERERDEARDEGATYFDNAVNKFLLTKRLTMDWERIVNLMEYKTGKKYLAKMEAYKMDHQFPDANELTGAIDGLLRIQDIYRLRTKDIAAGILDGVQYDTELQSKHCHDIAKRALQENKLKFAHSWLQEALERFEDVSDNYHMDDEAIKQLNANILTSYIETKYQLGDMFGVNETYSDWMMLEPENTKLANDYIRFMDIMGPYPLPTVDLSDEHDPIPENLLATDEFARFKFTCSGHIRVTPSEERELRCGYMTETHPFLLLAPLKVEELNHDPLLVIYYDVISEREIELVKSLANMKIERATVMGVNGSIVSPVRTSQFAFLPKSTHPVLQTIDQRVEDMTNMDMDYAEDHQFANYGIGGHYAQHHDYFAQHIMDGNPESISNFEMGNRIATVLFYLTDVEQGGGTAFPYLKQKLMPIKGAAAFWYNIHASGKVDIRSLHGACPIISGSKWVQNRWIREHDQSERRPCDLWDDSVVMV